MAIIEVLFVLSSIIIQSSLRFFRVLVQLFVSLGFLAVSALSFSAQQELEKSSEQAIAELSLKHVSYARLQEDYLNAITDILIAEKKGIWKHLPKGKAQLESDNELLTKPVKSNLTLLEASLYHYFGMQKEAEKRYQQVIKQSTAHIPSALLLLVRYYYQQQDFKNVLKWVVKVDEAQLSDQQKSYKFLYELDAYIRLGQRKNALSLLANTDEYEWLPVLSYNSERLKTNAPSSKTEASNDSTWLSLDEEELSPLLKELDAQKNLQLGMDASKKGHWGTAVEFFKTVPTGTLRTVEARRWLAWSLVKDGQLESASKVWRSLTRLPSYQTIDAYAMAASVTEQLGDKAKALSWFEKSINYYADQVETLSGLRADNQTGVWIESTEASNDTFWSPVQMQASLDQTLALWTNDVWQDKGFQQILSDHRDLQQITTLLEAKKDYIETFELMVENRRLGYEKTTTLINNMKADDQLNQYHKDARSYREQLESVSDYKDIYAVGSKEQLINHQLLKRVKENIEQLKSMGGYARKHKTASYDSRYEHLDRIFFWEMREAFPGNFRQFQREVKNLTDQLKTSDQALVKMNAAKRIAPSRFKGYAKKIDRLAKQVQNLANKANTLRQTLRSQVIAMLDKKLAERELVAQRYLEQSILASARLRDELAFELGDATVSNSQNTLASNGRVF